MRTGDFDNKAQAGVSAAISWTERLIFARVRHPYGRCRFRNWGGGSDERRRSGLCACFSRERPHPPWRGAASRRALHALALLSVADRRCLLRCRGHGPDRREHCPARIADFGAGIRFHLGKRKLGRARLSLGCRGIHADLRPALPDLWQKAVLHRRLRPVHFGQRSLRLCARPPHPGRASVLAGRRRSDGWRQSMALVVEATDKSRRGRALGLYAAAQAVGISAGPVAGGLLIGTLGWRWVFWVNVPIGLISIVAAWLVLPVTAQHGIQRSIGAAPSCSRPR